MSSGVVADESGQSRSKVFSGESRPELSHINCGSTRRQDEVVLGAAVRFPRMGREAIAHQ